MRSYKTFGILSVLVLLSSIAAIFIKHQVSRRQASSIGIIGGADGPTAVYTTIRFSTSDLLFYVVIGLLFLSALVGSIIAISAYHKKK